MVLVTLMKMTLDFLLSMFFNLCLTPSVTLRTLHHALRVTNEG